MSLLTAAGTAPDLLLGLVAGVWVDRLRRRPLLIAADLGRAALLLVIPLAALAGVLSIALLVAVAFGLGLLTTLFGIAYSSYLPALVPRDKLVEANGRLEASSAVAGVAGPGLAGGLVQALTAPVAMAVDALSFLVSALLLGRIRTVEAPPRAEARRGLWREVGEGLRAVAGSPVLRALAGTTMTFNFFDSFLIAIYVLYLTRELGLGAAAVGAVFAIGGAGGVLGAALAGRIARWAGLGRALIGAILLAAIGELGIALAGGPPLAAVALVGVAEATVQGAAVVFGVNGVSLRQAATPDRLLGRVNATMRFMRTGLVPLGALLGGLVAKRYGLRPSVLVAGLGTLLAVLWVLFSPIRSLQVAPPPVEE
jgi:predicted MFS family arabinose efflux permease